MAVLDALCSDSSETDSDCRQDEACRLPFRRDEADVDDWLKQIGSEHPHEDNLGLADDEVDLPNLADYEQFISDSRAYRWLLSRIDSHSQLEVRCENRMASIAADIRSQLLSHPTLRRVTRAAAPAITKAIFSLDWNLHQFFAEQEYMLPPEKVFDHVICLAGTHQQAQAMTIAEFLEQTWPQNHGPLISLLKMALSSPSASGHECASPWMHPASKVYQQAC